MAIPTWLALAALAGAVLGGGGLASIMVALIRSNESVPTHLMAELKRMGEERIEDRNRVDAVEAQLVALGDHVDILEAHIWKQLPPPPPPRPTYRPYRPARSQDLDSKE